MTLRGCEAAESDFAYRVASWLQFTSWPNATDSALPSHLLTQLPVHISRALILTPHHTRVLIGITWPPTGLNPTSYKHSRSVVLLDGILTIQACASYSNTSLTSHSTGSVSIPALIKAAILQAIIWYRDYYRLQPKHWSSSGTGPADPAASRRVCRTCSYAPALTVLSDLGLM